MNKVISTWLVVVAIFRLTAGAQPLPTADLGNQLDKVLREHQVPGVAVALLAGNSVHWTGTQGWADRDRQVPVTDSTLFGVGSIAKTFLVLATMIAQEQGFLDLHDPVQTLLPTLVVSNRWAATDSVRLVHLLEHTSGFDEAHYDLFHQADASTSFSEIMKRSRRSLTTRWAPGRYYAYNNLGATVAAYALETTVSEPFALWVRRSVLSPLGMRHATYHPSDSLAYLLARSYTGPDNAEVPFPNLPQWPAGSLVASVSDMSRLVSLLLHRGRFYEQRLLSAASVERMETPESSLRATAGVRYGYGKGLRITLEHGHRFYGHGGRYGGFLSEFGYSPTLGVGYVILLNKSDNRRALKAIKQLLLTRLLPDTLSTVASSVTAPGEEPPAALVGSYQSVTSEMQITQFLMRLIDLQFIVQEDEHWYQQSVLGDRQELLPVGKRLFRRAEEPEASSAFVQDTNGDWLWLNEATYRRIPIWQGYATWIVAAGCVLSLVLSFVVLLVGGLVQLIRRRFLSLTIILPVVAVGCLIGMIVSLWLGYDPMVKLSSGALLFWLFGWLFLGVSPAGLFFVLRRLYQTASRPAITYVALATCLSATTIAAYLMYWNVIGLRLWNY